MFKMYRGILQYFSKWFNCFFSTLQVYLYALTRPLIKWILRRTTGLCELQRTCYCEPAGASRIIGVEMSLNKSKHQEIQKLLKFLDRAASEKLFSEDNTTILKNAVLGICCVKKIHLDAHHPFGKSFGECVSVIWGYKQLLDELEELRRTEYSSENVEHEQKLLHLWNTLMPGRVLETRVTSSWQDMGFQGDDPKTDFRGMGMLGLENLLYFSKNYTDAALHVLSHSNHPKHGYPFAIVGINLTHMALNLWKDGSAKTHSYNLCCHQTKTSCQNHGARFVSAVFINFCFFVIQSEMRSINSFSRIRKQKQHSIVFLLYCTATFLGRNTVMDNLSK
nr:EOG090X0AMT [Eurycercus lamellatus]